MINSYLVREFINNCPVSDFSANSHGVIENDKLADYINLKSKQLIETAADDFTETVNQKHGYEKESATRQPILVLCTMLFNFVMGIYNYTVNEKVSLNPLNICESNLMRNILIHFQGYISMIMSGIPEASYAQLRTMYESYIIFFFIKTYPELAKPYIDHSVINRVHILKSFSQFKSEDDHQKDYDVMVDRYGNIFKEIYGWSATVIQERKNRNLAGMVSCLKLEAYKPYYVMTSEMIHASSFSVHNQFDSHEFVTEFAVGAIEILTNGIIHFMEIAGIEENKRLLLMNIIYALREDLLGEEQGV